MKHKSENGIQNLECVEKMKMKDGVVKKRDYGGMKVCE